MNTTQGVKWDDVRNGFCVYLSYVQPYAPLHVNVSVLPQKSWSHFAFEWAVKHALHRWQCKSLHNSYANGRCQEKISSKGESERGARGRRCGRERLSAVRDILMVTWTFVKLVSPKGFIADDQERKLLTFSRLQELVFFDYFDDRGDTKWRDFLIVPSDRSPQGPVPKQSDDLQWRICNMHCPPTLMFPNSIWMFHQRAFVILTKNSFSCFYRVF